MPQLQNLVLTDRAATPVNHTFTPRDIVTGVGTVAETSGLPLGDNRVSLSLTRNTNGRYKPVVKFVFPTLQTEVINGISSPKVVRTAYAELHFNFDSTSTEEERNNIVGMVQDALTSSKTLVNDTVVKLQGVY
jgi:hypothetical protein